MVGDNLSAKSIFGTLSLLLLIVSSALIRVDGTGYTQPPGSVGHWNLDQGSGTIAYDSSGYSNHGTVYGASWASGKVSGALKFDGVNDYVDCGNDETLDPTQAVTIEAWVIFNQLPSVAKHFMAIAGKSGGGTDLDLQAETDNRFKFFIGPGDPNVAVSNTVVETGKWYHIAGTYQANNFIKIYVNGVLEKTTSIKIARNTNSNKFCIGKSGVWPGRFFNGIIDEVKIYNRALSAEEIWAEYKHMLPAPMLSAATGNNGKTIKVTGSVGAVPAGYTIKLYWDTITEAWDGIKGLMNSTIAMINGSYEVWFKVPEATNGAHNILVMSEDGDTASTVLTVHAKNKNIPSAGLPGDTISGSFYGFHASKDLAFILSSVDPPISTTVTNEVLDSPNGVETEFTGTFAHKYIVPGSIHFRASGDQYARDDGWGNIIGYTDTPTVNGTINYVTGEYDIIFVTAPPAKQNGLGTDYSYWSTSSAVGSTQFDLGTSVTNSLGSAFVSWKVPKNVTYLETYKIISFDAAGVRNFVYFKIMGIQLSSKSGPTGKIISLTGDGFTPNATWSAEIGSMTLFEGGEISMDGHLQGGNNIMIPYGLSPGNYTITVWDSEDYFEPCTQFTVTYNTSLMVTPDAAPNNYNVTVYGKGFSYSATGQTDLNFTLYNTTLTGAVDHIWNMNVKQNWSVNGPHRATVNSTGIVRAYWIVPDSVTIGIGTYHINATDTNNFLAQTTFNVIAPHVVAIPTKTAFSIGDTILFQLEDNTNTTPVEGSMIKIYNPNGSLVFTSDTLDVEKWVKAGLWYNLPYSAQTVGGIPMVIPENATTGTWSYKWIETDGKDIVTGTFIVTPKSIPPGSLKVSVKDSNGNPLSGVAVSSFKQPNGQTALSGTTDTSGVITFTGLTIGNYTLQISKNGYLSDTFQGVVSSGVETQLSSTLQTQPSGGIPGYPFSSLIVGVMFSAALLWLCKYFTEYR
jgi:hypothetical protein